MQNLGVILFSISFIALCFLLGSFILSKVKHVPYLGKRNYVIVFTVTLLIGFILVGASGENSNKEPGAINTVVYESSEITTQQLSTQEAATVAKTTQETTVQATTQPITQPATTQTEVPAVQTEPATSPTQAIVQKQPVTSDPQNSDIIVHITKTGDKYHRSGCRYLSKSDIEVTLSQALGKGLSPCSVCKPPVR